MGLPSYTRDVTIRSPRCTHAIGSLATLDLPMVVDLIGIYGLKGPYFFAALSSHSKPPPPPPFVGNCSGQSFEENPFVPISSGLLVQADEGVSSDSTVQGEHRGLSDLDNEIICAIQGKFVGVSEEMFASVFELPTTGLTDVDDVPKNLVYDARSIFSKSGEPVQTSSGSFYDVTHERFLLMTTIHFGLKINWSKILFEILKGMVTKTSKQAKRFSAQICSLLKSAPNLTMGEAKTFPPLKIFTAKTVGTYIAKKNGIDDSHEEDEPVVKKTAVKKVVSKKRSAYPGDETAVKKKRTTMGRAAPTATDFVLVTVAQEAVPIQMTRMREHGIKWERESNSRLFEGDKRDRGAVIARSNPNIKSSCWIRTMTLVNGSWVIQEGGDFWKPISYFTLGAILEVFVVLVFCGESWFYGESWSVVKTSRNAYLYRGKSIRRRFALSNQSLAKSASSNAYVDFSRER
ncbi:endonuclease [Dorcoceras hygrometricum]|uniref:Endonuclease n=1 Tax=Dorcoceras hygrometricum TaxID=472368 RepID=A0A2Z7B5T4_9LAMI|nr:endonuclease [Dorcoceras hygrometricum]